MPSPFPGMNPYLEQSDVWEDFHERFIVAAADALEEQVGANYVVKVEMRLYLHELSAEERRYVDKGDFGVSGGPATATPSSSAKQAAPLELEFTPVDQERYSWIEIRDRRRRPVVTVVELLSPTNKAAGPDRDDYLRKRNLLLVSPANLVEIDLRRGGVRPGPPSLPPCAYYALVSRVTERPKLGVWPLMLADPLPTLAIPRTPPDPDVFLNLQEILHRVYDRAGYAKYIYEGSPEPPLDEVDAEWARNILAGTDGDSNR